ncbi:rhomboid family intramembrane serine protease [Arsenicibacter rosenii]|uniref:Rhomboid family intramembrane serine protease n=1 Tax=Arsenicibacter rosenii TaxID=1750698 RepID=A0A1S2VGP2_9BACT|nr:rhomboid family intramembrane serine protease [Arsenicibacter rosenii]OIN57892.1 rhomboid family intramembrane serine protease [Arsenicibacter rosenii]
MISLSPVVRVILILNVLAFLVTGSAVINQFGLHSVLSDDFRPVQLLTHMFLHGGLGHIFSNMIGLLVFGPMLEGVWGSRRFVFFYLFTGLGAAALYLGVNYYEMSHLLEAVDAYRSAPTPENFMSFITDHAGSSYDRIEPFLNSFEANPRDPRFIQESLGFVNTYWLAQVNEPMVGASGAIFGVIMAFGLLFPNTELILLFPPIPVKAKYMVLFYGAYEIYSGVYRAQADNVAHFAHIGGMLFAFILVKYWGSQRKKFY